MAQQMPARLPGGAVDLSSLAAGAAAPQQQAPGASPQAPAGPGVPVPSLVLDATDDGFEQIAQLSTVVPVVVDLWAEWCQPCKTLGPILERVTRELDGRVVLAKVDVDANPGLAQLFQAQSIPTVLALIGGRALPLFQGAIPEAQVRDVLGQLVEVAAQQGVSGRAIASDGEADDAAGAVEPAEPEIPETHRPAVEAIERGDYETAVREYEAVLAKAPADAEARAALVQVKLLHRLSGRGADEIRAAAAQDPADVAAQLLVADLDVSGGHVEDAFLRLLDLFAASTGDDERARIREHMLELFEVVGVADPRVIAARGRLANLLY